MSGAEIMSGAESRKWVHQEPTNQPTNQSSNMTKVKDANVTDKMHMIVGKF